MHEHEAAESAEEVDDGDPVENRDPVESGDETLDGFEADLVNVESTLDALDADDLDTAEAVVAGLGAVETPAPDVDGA